MKKKINGKPYNYKGGYYSDPITADIIGTILEEEATKLATKSTSSTIKKPTKTISDKQNDQ